MLQRKSHFRQLYRITYRAVQSTTLNFNLKRAQWSAARANYGDHPRAIHHATYDAAFYRSGIQCPTYTMVIVDIPKHMRGHDDDADGDEASPPGSPFSHEADIVDPPPDFGTRQGVAQQRN